MNGKRKDGCFSGIYNTKKREKREKAAREAALAEGFSEGIGQEKIEIAKNMVAKSMDIDVISEVTGLSKEEIEELK